MARHLTVPTTRTHCDRHHDEQELTVFLNTGVDGYFVCNRCGLQGDVIVWVGHQLFGDA